MQWVESHASYNDVSIAEQLNADAHQLAINCLALTLPNTWQTISLL
jgi:hypothetical protein